MLWTRSRPPTYIDASLTASNPPTGPEDLQAEIEDIQLWIEHIDDNKRASLSAATAPRPPSAPQAAAPTSVTVLDRVITLKALDNTGLTGCIVEVPNALWPHDDDDEWDPTGKSACKVVGQCVERFKYANGRAAPSHVIEHQGGNPLPCQDIGTQRLRRTTGASSGQVTCEITQSRSQG